MVVDYLSSQLDWAGYQVSTTWGSGPGNFQVVETSIGGQFLDIEVAENELRFTMGSSLNNQNPALSTALTQAVNQLHVFEPAPTAFVLDSGEHVELYTRAVVDTSVGLDDQALLNAILGLPANRGHVVKLLRG
ncbi:hypothetical protein [Corynebacterium macginleyi]|uniref:hypothetical protein n=1 Tax=Corynebacterium macginleyi TaxID=38290 RepID=UPI001F2A82C3|nr:hypothetical protein [Corynebacterium macginleyi]